MSTSKRSRSTPLPPSPEAKKNRITNPTRFLILSDTHNLPLPKNLPACDVLLHCGDLTEDGTPESLSQALSDLGSVNAELKLVIAGNHEIYLDSEYCTAEGGSAADIERARSLISSDPSSLASKNGITFLEEGTHAFTLRSGASFTLYASPFTPAFGASAFQYPTIEDRYNPTPATPSWARNTGTEKSRIPDNVDIVMTHGPAQYILDTTLHHRPSCSAGAMLCPQPLPATSWRAAGCPEPGLHAFVQRTRRPARVCQRSPQPAARVGRRIGPETMPCA
ncbi:hypothetical protein OPT61_g5047 [Boeremia exigua]|uniref:Uncharacterized protein n=1 Tax=Boeremia exigua TaxID=749465 RepID=A0ACC2IBU7_9PLEO|nr:hypothetical protein OPT61_g5047 [Boeremia exigua]